MITWDHASNTKRGGVCVYYKTFLPSNDLDNNYLQEIINFQLVIVGNRCVVF